MFRAWFEEPRIMTHRFGLGEDNFKECSPVDGECYDCEIEFADSIMQFTGLLDKNGKEIYEGDIIRDGLSPSMVEFKNHTKTSYGHGDSNTTQYLGYAFHFWGSGLGMVEVIGNVHEHPELLNQTP